MLGTYKILNGFFSSCWVCSRKSSAQLYEEKKKEERKKNKELESEEKKQENQPEKTTETPLVDLGKTEETDLENYDSLTCPITQEIFKDPVLTPYGHCFERKNIEDWLEIHNTCPLTNQPLNKSQLVPCYAVKSLIEELRSKKSSKSLVIQ